jgi:hypothetical protein
LEVNAQCWPCYRRGMGGGIYHFELLPDLVGDQYHPVTSQVLFVFGSVADVKKSLFRHAAPDWTKLKAGYTLHHPCTQKNSEDSLLAQCSPNHAYRRHVSEHRARA